MAKKTPDVFEAIRLLRENANDEAGRNPRVPPDFDWDKLAGYGAAPTFQSPPPNSITAKDFQEKYTCTQRLAYDRLNELVKSGHMETGFFRTPQKRKGAYYWFVDKKKKK